MYLQRTYEQLQEYCRTDRSIIKEYKESISHGGYCFLTSSDVRSPGPTLQGVNCETRIHRALVYLAVEGKKTRPCTEGALSLLDPIFDPQYALTPHTYLDRARETIPIHLAAQAHSIAAYAYYLNYKASPEERAQIALDARDLAAATTAAPPSPTSPLSPYSSPPPRRNSHPRTRTYAATPPGPTPRASFSQLQHLLCAARHAGAGARLHFHSQAVLEAGYAFLSLTIRAGLDAQVQLRELGPLWRALRRRTPALAARQQAALRAWPRPERGQRARCAACGTGEWLLGPCQGCCPAALRPSYCSEECQKSDWERHRAICDGGLLELETVPAPFTVVQTYEEEEAAREIVRNFANTMHVETAELIADEEEANVVRNGRIMYETRILCPYGVPNKLVRFVTKRYDV
ncbi:hypothetical protein BD413DRAFT_490993 [Trametes elegans]|nr:hypothetical protein BD413DRAFT_490993 [Trametes elegans]